MKSIIISIGRFKDNYFRDFFQDYAKRVTSDIQLIEVEEKKK